MKVILRMDGCDSCTTMGMRLTPLNHTLTQVRDFPGGPVDENLPCNAGGVGSFPGLGTEIPHAVGQLSL